MALTKIKTGGIADNAITNAKMADDAIDSADFADGSIDNIHVATGLDAVKLADGTVTNAEFQYINTLSSNAQTQISAALPKAGGTMTGDITLDGSSASKKIRLEQDSTHALQVGWTYNGTVANASSFIKTHSANNDLLIDAKNILLSTDGGGNVGIGVTPSNLLDLQKNQNDWTVAKLDNTTVGTGATASMQVQSGANLGYFSALNDSYTTSGFRLPDTVHIASNDNTGGGLILASGHASTSKIRFYTGQWGSEAERMRIDSAGKVGIGLTPATTLQVASNETHTDNHFTTADKGIVIGSSTTLGEGLALWHRGDGSDVIASLYDSSGVGLKFINRASSSGNAVVALSLVNGNATFGGNVIKPNNCSVYINWVFGSNNVGAGTYTYFPSSHGTVNEDRDVGGDFASGIFTAPVQGSYLFNVIGRPDDVSTSSSYFMNEYRMQIQKSTDSGTTWTGEKYPLIWVDPTAIDAYNDVWGWSGVDTVYLNAGDQLRLEFYFKITGASAVVDLNTIFITINLLG